VLSSPTAAPLPAWAVSPVARYTTAPPGLGHVAGAADDAGNLYVTFIDKSLTEARPGVYVFGDLKQVELGTLARDECALSVLATVVSRPAPGRIILDCGTKALSSDHYATLTYGELKEYPDVRIARASEEHGIIEGVDLPLRIGDKVEVLPNHACATAAQFGEYQVMRADGSLAVWERFGGW